MAKENFITLQFDARAQRSSTSVVQNAPSGMKIRLLRSIAMLTGSIWGRSRHQAIQSYGPRKSREDESRLEFQRFLYW
ncbi:MAG: hypothetical protein OEN50_09500 [Deltaproteobacteria bacterium]|nr:hypothetical protein [Deltaproteobacteria bacterium]